MTKNIPTQIDETIHWTFFQNGRRRRKFCSVNFTKKLMR